MKLPLSDKRQLGRRKSDWLMPVVLWAIALSGVLLARHYWLRVRDLEAVNASLKQQVQLLERRHK